MNCSPFSPITITNKTRNQIYVGASIRSDEWRKPNGEALYTSHRGHLKGNSSLILAIFCIDINNGWITFTRIICMDD